MLLLFFTKNSHAQQQWIGCGPSSFVWTVEILELTFFACEKLRLDLTITIHCNRGWIEYTHRNLLVLSMRYEMEIRFENCDWEVLDFQWKKKKLCVKQNMRFVCQVDLCKCVFFSHFERRMCIFSKEIDGMSSFSYFQWENPMARLEMVFYCLTTCCAEVINPSTATVCPINPRRVNSIPTLAEWQIYLLNLNILYLIEDRMNFTAHFACWCLLNRCSL